MDQAEGAIYCKESQLFEDLFSKSTQYQIFYDKGTRSMMFRNKTIIFSVSLESQNISKMEIPYDGPIYDLVVHKREAYIAYSIAHNLLGKGKQTILQTSKEGKMDPIIHFEWIYGTDKNIDFILCKQSGIFLYRLDRDKTSLKEQKCFYQEVSACWYDPENEILCCASVHEEGKIHPFFFKEKKPVFKYKGSEFQVDASKGTKHEVKSNVGSFLQNSSSSVLGFLGKQITKMQQKMETVNFVTSGDDKNKDLFLISQEPAVCHRIQLVVMYNKTVLVHLNPFHNKVSLYTLNYDKTVVSDFSITSPAESGVRFSVCDNLLLLHSTKELLTLVYDLRTKQSYQIGPPLQLQVRTHLNNKSISDVSSLTLESLKSRNQEEEEIEQQCIENAILLKAQQQQKQSEQQQKQNTVKKEINLLEEYYQNNSNEEYQNNGSNQNTGTDINLLDDEVKFGQSKKQVDLLEDVGGGSELKWDEQALQKENKYWNLLDNNNYQQPLLNQGIDLLSEEVKPVASQSQHSLLLEENEIVSPSRILKEDIYDLTKQFFPGDDFIINIKNRQLFQMKVDILQIEQLAKDEIEGFNIIMRRSNSKEYGLQHLCALFYSRKDIRFFGLLFNQILANYKRKLTQNSLRSEIITPTDIQESFFFTLVRTTSIKNRSYLLEIFTEYMKAAADIEIETSPQLQIVLARLLIEEGKFNTFLFFVQYRVITDSEELALSLLSLHSNKQFMQGYQLGLDMLFRLKKYYPIVNILLNRGQILIVNQFQQALDFMRRHSFIQIKLKELINLFMTQQGDMSIESIQEYFKEMLSRSRGNEKLGFSYVDFLEELNRQNPKAQYSINHQEIDLL